MAPGLNPAPGSARLPGHSFKQNRRMSYFANRPATLRCAAMALAAVVATLCYLLTSIPALSAGIGCAAAIVLSTFCRPRQR
ncbi:MAG: hypothetical protein GAK45_02069 [Pseudomonas citronellolis]|nr:MAG: hypothetical protein GAK45_02069 [Pseudomonas citronellolis]